MPVELIPAPGRQWKTWSTWLAVATAVFAAIYAALPEFRDYLSPELFAGVMSVLALAIKIANLIRQAIPVSDEQRNALIEAAMSAPEKPADPTKGDTK